MCRLFRKQSDYYFDGDQEGFSADISRFSQLKKWW